MTPEEIEQSFASAGWDIDNGFSGYLVIGYSGDTLSILADKEVFETEADDPLFEILDHMRGVTYWVREMPTPQQAAELLQEHGRLPEEWDEPRRLRAVLRVVDKSPAPSPKPLRV